MLQTRDRLGRMIPFVRKKEKLAFYKLLTFLPFFFSFFCSQWSNETDVTVHGNRSGYVEAEVKSNYDISM